MDSIKHHFSELLLRWSLDVYQSYEWALSFSDKRVAAWPLMQSPFPTVMLIVLYLCSVHYGPQLMRSRQPFEMRWILVFYNFAMTFLNLYIGLELLVCAWKQNYNWACQLVDFSSNPYEVRIAKALWWYYFSKLLEFCDTFFFILRKKNNQLTFLHIYHHSTMFGLWWIGVKWVPGGSAVPGAMTNSFVHVLMYLYYGLASIGPIMQPYLWWKKYLTMIQLIQFVSAVVMGVKAIIYNCPFTRWMQYALVAYSFSFIVLFGIFYLNSYSPKKPEKKEA
ncbi:very long chain fatty acid elongase 4 [Parasteatoda tepidariorum]|uniref:very long chain fatty acid elongase 4 n=1 Tax=Parasteatoda tepidariorum TaxID=114398 RepID=UPI00077F9531|nr:elongation of very long chain fatty acids protein 4 [Parasteatoda tepidariorum]XP_021003374.1 elongation of very long chain fatty acids protein 4 [Parasteatoda tepidariorum]